MVTLIAPNSLISVSLDYLFARSINPVQNLNRRGVPSMKKWLKRHTPPRHVLMESRWLRPLGFALARPGVWNMNRRSAALGVAVGLAAGLMPGPTQVLAAALVSVLCRANLPTAVLTTFYTNPITIVPLYMLAYQIGAMVTRNGGELAPLPAFDIRDLSAYFLDMGQWVFSMGNTLVIGLGIQAVLFACVGYLAVNGLWRWSVARKWRAR
jgi:uncharacterized protein